MKTMRFCLLCLGHRRVPDRSQGQTPRASERRRSPGWTRNNMVLIHCRADENPIGTGDVSPSILLTSESIGPQQRAGRGVHAQAAVFGSQVKTVSIATHEATGEFCHIFVQPAREWIPAGHRVENCAIQAS